MAGCLRALAGRYNCNAMRPMRNGVETWLAPNECRRAESMFRWAASRQASILHFSRGAGMSSKLSMMKTMVVTAVLVAGVSGLAQAADNSARDQAFAIQNKRSEE